MGFIYLPRRAPALHRPAGVLVLAALAVAGCQRDDQRQAAAAPPAVQSPPVWSTPRDAVSVTPPQTADADALPDVPPADGMVVAAMEGSGFIVHQMTATSNLVDVNYTAEREITPEDLANLQKIGEQIVSLNLRGSGLRDAEAKVIGGFRNLRTLRLQDTPVTDAGLGDLAGLKDLRQLTLVGTKVTDAGLGRIAALPKLKSLYIWGSGVTPAGIDKLKAERKDLKVVSGVTAKDVPPLEAMRKPVNN